MAKGILGKKLGMTQIFEADGKMIPVTVVEAGPCIVIQNKTEETDGYNAVQLGFGDIKEKQLSKPMKGRFDKVAADIFAAGEKVDAVGVSRGRGFAGTIKLHNFSRGPMKHGSKSHREPGSMGPMHSGPGGRVIKGKKLPGRMGGNNATVLRLTVAKVDKERNLIMIKGAVPGANGTFLVIRQTVKPDVIKKNRVENKPHAVNPQKASARK